MGKVKEMDRFSDYDQIPSVVQDYLLSIADAMFITDIPLAEINEWAYNNVGHLNLLLMGSKSRG
jgi:hypothetical protein